MAARTRNKHVEDPKGDCESVTNCIGSLFVTFFVVIFRSSVRSLLHLWVFSQDELVRNKGTIVPQLKD